MSTWGGEASYNQLAAILAQLKAGIPVSLQNLGWLTAPPEGKQVRSVTFTWNSDATPATAVFGDQSGSTAFTLTFTWSAGTAGTFLTAITRS